MKRFFVGMFLLVLSAQVSASTRGSSSSGSNMSLSNSSSSDNSPSASPLLPQRLRSWSLTRNNSSQGQGPQTQAPTPWGQSPEMQAPAPVTKNKAPSPADIEKKAKNNEVTVSTSPQVLASTPGHQLEPDKEKALFALIFKRADISPSDEQEANIVRTLRATQSYSILINAKPEENNKEALKKLILLAKSEAIRILAEETN